MSKMISKKSIIRENKQKEISDYEHNLQLHYDSKKEELNHLIRVTMPQQERRVRIAMGANVIFIGLVLQILRDVNQSFIILLFIGIAVVFSFISLLYLFMTFRCCTKTMYGAPSRKQWMAKNVKPGSWSKYFAIWHLFHSTEVAVRYNGIGIIKKAKLIYKAFQLSFVSLLFVILSFSVFYFQLGEKSVQKQSTKTTCQTTSRGSKSELKSIEDQ